jgi:hypothetical protein
MSDALPSAIQEPIRWKKHAEKSSTNLVESGKATESLYSVLEPEESDDSIRDVHKVHLQHLGRRYKEEYPRRRKLTLRRIIEEFGYEDESVQNFEKAHNAALDAYKRVRERSVNTLRERLHSHPVSNGDERTEIYRFTTSRRTGRMRDAKHTEDLMMQAAFQCLRFSQMAESVYWTIEDGEVPIYVEHPESWSEVVQAPSYSRMKEDVWSLWDNYKSAEAFCHFYQWRTDINATWKRCQGPLPCGDVAYDVISSEAEVSRRDGADVRGCDHDVRWETRQFLEKYDYDLPEIMESFQCNDRYYPPFGETDGLWFHDPDPDAHRRDA